MPSQLQSQTARTNGAKSHGPVTPEGRAKSSANSVRHGFTAKSVVLPHESTEEFQLLLDAYVDQFQPQTQVEMDLVETMAVARWRLRRIVTIETNFLHNELVRHAEQLDNEFSEMDGDNRLAWVFRRQADGGQSLALLVRYEGTLNRSFDRAFKQLLLLQSTRNGAARPAAAPGSGSFGSGTVPVPIPATPAPPAPAKSADPKLTPSGEPPALPVLPEIAIS